MDNIPPEMAQQVMQMFMSDPDLMGLMQNPQMMQKLQAIMADPSRMSQYQNDPDIQLIMRKMAGMGLGGGMGGGMGGMGGGGMGGGGMGSGIGGYSNGHVNPPGDKVRHASTQMQLNSLHAEAGDKKLLVIDFTASWCGPCKRIAPAFSQMSNEYDGKAIFVKIDGDQAKPLCQALGVRAYPTFMFFIKGEKKEEMSGADEGKLRSIISTYVNDLNREPVNPYKHFPLKDSEMVHYNKVEWEIVAEKLTLMAKEQHLEEAECKDLVGLLATLKEVVTYHSSQIPSSQFALVIKMLKWPADGLGNVINLVRMMVLHPQSAKTWAAKTAGGEDDLVLALCRVAKAATKDTVHLLILRALSNCFSRRVLCKFIVAEHEQVLDIVATLFEKYGASEDKGAGNVRVSALNLIINFAIIFREDSKLYEEAKVQCLTMLMDLLGMGPAEASVVYRILVVIGTLIYRDVNCREIAQGLQAPETVESLKATHKADANVVDCAKELAKEFSS